MVQVKAVVVGFALALIPFTVAVHGDTRAGDVEAVVRAGGALDVGSLADYTVLVVAPVTVLESAETEGFNDAWVKPLQRGLVRQLRKKKAFASIVEAPAAATAADAPAAPADGSATVQKRAVLTSTVVLYNKGSRAARFIVGMGAGSARTRMRFVVKDLETDEELLRTEREGKYAGWLSPTGGTNDEAIMESAGDAVDRLIDELRKNRPAKQQ